MGISVEEQIQNELAPGERLLWSGRPRGGLRDCPPALPAIPFLLVWTAPVIGVAGGEIAERGLSSDALFASMMVFVGLSMLVYLPFLLARGPIRAVYGITDRRVLIIGGLFRREVVSLRLQAITPIVRREGRDGSGTLIFNDFARSCGVDAGHIPEFASIEDARHVYSLIHDAKANQEEA